MWESKTHKNRSSRATPRIAEVMEQRKKEMHAKYENNSKDNGGGMVPQLCKLVEQNGARTVCYQRQLQWVAGTRKWKRQIGEQADNIRSITSIFEDKKKKSTFKSIISTIELNFFSSTRASFLIFCYDYLESSFVLSKRLKM
ncbi:uncharacterized protein DS421_18g634540 [Arachis hypogaea]|nr:uncharacterized protein DS421_18g634540 [Arachis hypogaea]